MGKLKVGGIYNDKKMNGYFIVLEENKQFVLFYTILCK